MMKKFLCIVAAAALCATPALADELQLRVVSTGDVSTIDGSSGPVAVIIQGQLTGVGGASDGLALWGANLDDVGLGDVDVPTYITDFDTPAGDLDMEEFKKNKGLTNPAGYGGTDSTTGVLWQIGGGQNTIANTGPTLYPSGSGAKDVGNSGWQNLAVGSIECDAGDTEDIVLTLDTGFANTIDTGQGAIPWDVTEATIAIMGALTVECGITEPECHYCDANCDGTVNAGDVLEVRKVVNFGSSPASSADNPRTDTNCDDTVNAGDVLEVRKVVNFGSGTGLPCDCTIPPPCP